MGVTLRTTFTPGARRGRPTARAPNAPQPETVPRSARLMALAIVLDEMVRTGRAESYAEIAAVAGVSRAHISQVLAMLSLAPEIQVAVLTGELQLGDGGRRGLASRIDWTVQRRRAA